MHHPGDAIATEIRDYVSMSLEVELAEVRDFLAEHAPFSALSVEDLTWLVGRLTVRYFRRGSAIMAPGQDNNSLYAVRSGAVEIRDRAGVLVDRGSDGMCFGATTLLGGNPSQFSATAIEDSLTLVMDAATFARLGEQSEEFAEFFDVQRSARMGAAIASQQLSHQGSAILKTRTAELATRAPVGVPLTATIREGAVTMAEHGVSALLVMDGPRLAGLVTDRDLRTRVLAAGVDPAEPITRIMTANPLVAPPGLAAKMTNPTLTSGGNGETHAIKKEMTGKAKSCEQSAKNKALGLRRIRRKSEAVSASPTPNITSPSTRLTKISTKCMSAMVGKAMRFASAILDR